MHDESAHEPALEPGPPSQSAMSGPSPVRRVGKGWVVAVFVAVAGLLALAACGAFVVLPAMRDRAALEERVREADRHYGAAVKRVEAVAVVTEDTEATLESQASSANAGLDAAAAELDDARATLEQLGPSEARDTYLSGLDEAEKGLGALREAVEFLDRAGGILRRVEAAAEAARTARQRLNEAIALANQDKYDAAKAKAGEGERLLKDAESSYRQAHEIDREAGLDKAAAHVAKQREEAVLLQRMADLGKAGKVSDYNDTISRVTKLRAEVDKLPQPEIVTDPDWAKKRMTSVGARVERHLGRADELVERAHTLLER